MIRLISRLLRHHSSESLSTDKEYPSDLYSSLIRQQILDTSKHSSPCSRVLKSCYLMQKCPECHRSNTGHVWVSPHFNVVQQGHLAADINTAPTCAMNLVFLVNSKTQFISILILRKTLFTTILVKHAWTLPKSLMPYRTRSYNEQKVFWRIPLARRKLDNWGGGGGGGLTFQLSSSVS